MRDAEFHRALRPSTDGTVRRIARALVLRTTGLSYAEYARRGFFALAWVAGLLLPMLLVAQALIPVSEGRTLRFCRRLALPLVVLPGAIMLSAGARMRLYVHYYGLSTDRLYATAFMLWLALVFVWLAVTVLRSRPRTFAAGLVVSGFLVLLTLNGLNPDALVARANLARGDAGRGGTAGTDLRYIATLGGDAVHGWPRTGLSGTLPEAERRRQSVLMRLSCGNWRARKLLPLDQYLDPMESLIRWVRQS